jgi:probable HAF family extracellular repeat protein
MKTQRLAGIIAMMLFTLAISAAAPAQNSVAQNKSTKHHHYKLIDVGTLGGPNSSVGFAGFVANTLNHRGTVIGNADTSIPDSSCLGCLLTHPFQWRNGVLTDLGSLPGLNNSYAFWIDSGGSIAGLSENGILDPFTGFPETIAVLWKDGKIINLGTLGGSSSGANAVNSRGQVVGGALNAIPDPFSATLINAFIPETLEFLFFPVATETHAFLWQDGAMQDLGTLGGPDSVAWFVNEGGQVAGQSTINSSPSATFGVPTVDPFFWDGGKMVDVGNLGGTFSFVSGLNDRGQMTGTMTLPGDSTNHPFFWDRGILTDMGTLGGDFGVPNAINESGEVVGFAFNEGNQAALAFVWRQGVITNLGTADGDSCSAAHSINSRGQVVGESSPSCFDPLQPLVHAFLWENGGPMVDLNALVLPGSELDSAAGVSINDRGEIDGDRMLPNGESHAFLLIPCDENHPNLEGCDYSLVDSADLPKVEPVRAAHTASVQILANRVAAQLQQGVPIMRHKKHIWVIAPTQ